eukprot:CAMPEP_0168178796 /NCGR_PEP_ID=MMETSP0139_2-20121125/9396_1 /TAXON_ID=44445 /ORGANISM="Pseudo-nitzschia australis, Strain 10249 10 AB" /LENGTH=194 /DNA_ID=CAMNT_0008098373 /DNA_START=64 /DNA_END=648 /DNA_ORIENTATION=+
MTVYHRLNLVVVLSLLYFVSVARQTQNGFALAFSSTPLPSPSSSVLSKSPIARTKSSSRTSSTTRVGMGMFDFIHNAFKSEEYNDRIVSASHILIATEKEAMLILRDIQEGTATFSEAAKSYSKCPSSSRGGSLGWFAPGTMVQKFDDIVFDKTVSIGSVQGPVTTELGYHLIVVEDRAVNKVRSEGKGFLLAN